jgi:hypothetical protein
VSPQWALPSARAVASARKYPLHQKVVRLSRHADFLVRRHVNQNIGVCGSIGFGKTSLIDTLQYSLWSLGDCGLILCAKPDTAKRAIYIANKCGQGSRVVHVYAGCKWRFDPVSFALVNSGGKIGTDEGMDDLWEMVSIIQRGEASQLSDGFFGPAGKEALNLSVRTIYLATGRFDINQLLQVCRETGGMSEEKIYQNPRQFVIMRMLQHLEEHARPAYREEVQLLRQYFVQQAELSDRTRSSIWVGASVRLAPMVDRGSPIYDLFFGGETNLTPRDIVEKRLLVVIDFPYSQYRNAARAIGVGFKQPLQKYCMNRPDDDFQTPCGIWADESACWLTERMDCEATERGRSARMYHVYSYQSESTLENGYGGGGIGVSRTKALLSNFVVRIMCGQIDAETRKSVEAMIGKTLKPDPQSGGFWARMKRPRNWKEQKQVQQWIPNLGEESLLGLESGKHGYIESYVFKGGTDFRWNGEKVLFVRWHQNRFRWGWLATMLEIVPTARACNGHAWPLDFIYDLKEEGWKGIGFRFLNFLSNGKMYRRQPGGADFHV